MLNIYFGDMPDAVYNTAVYFKNTYLDEWITDPLSVSIIKGIDKAHVISAHAIESPVLGSISPLGLSGGTKTLLLINNMPDKIFNASTCGNNCARWLLKIGSAKDITVNLRHIMDFGGRKFTIRVANNGQIVHSMDELVEIAVQYI